MQKQMSPEKKLQYMTETPLPRLVFQLATPAVVSMLISSLYNMLCGKILIRLFKTELD